MNVGVIGTGNMGENHLRTYATLRNHCTLVGVFDVDQSRCQDAASRYGTIAYNSLDALLNDVDAVSITVPTPFHYEVGMACIQKGVHVLMEKPIAATELEAIALKNAANKANITLQVGHIELFNPLIKTLRTIVKQEKILAIETHRMAPFHEQMRNIDVVHDLMIHDLYLVHALSGKHFEELHTFGITDENPSHASVIARSKEGIIVELTASFRSTKKVRSIIILAEDAYISADLLSNQITITRRLDQLTYGYPRTSTETIYIPSYLQPLTIELQDFLDCIKAKRTPSVSADEGIKALQLSSMISDAIKKK
ncbi:hypothetical protein DH09_19340 [Bacillaceae bacterium JMAK1]|nr:hypothetical protein DH09_19340 [Bacillaceae bacterium JMAK1]